MRETVCGRVCVAEGLDHKKIKLFTLFQSSLSAPFTWWLTITKWKSKELNTGLLKSMSVLNRVLKF